MIHAVRTNDIFEMGGLWKKMPLTGVYFLVGGAGAGGHLPLFAGFLLEGRDPGRGLGRAASRWPSGSCWSRPGLTAFYMFRVVFVAFFGAGRAGHAHESRARDDRPDGRGGATTRWP